MSNQLPEFPRQLMSYNLKDNTQLNKEIKEMLCDLAARYMEVSAAIRIKWTYPEEEMRKSKIPEVTIGTRYLKEYNNIFAKEMDEWILALNELLCGGKIAPAEKPAIEEMRRRLKLLQRNTADAVWAALKSNYRQAEKRLDKRTPATRRIIG
ncbi:MAG TPA: hypothetical protein HPQ04_05810 [Rhodospirillaceae bacterium]|nr:hypothetical protein [Rhodospirillaceae bacterium]